MNMDAVGPGPIGWLVGAPTGLVLVGKATVILALAWAASLSLRGRNPRWRVVLWRATAIGLGVSLGLALAPPVVAWRVASIKPTRAEAAPVNGPDRPLVPSAAPATRFVPGGRGPDETPGSASAQGPDLSHPSSNVSREPATPASRPVVGEVVARGEDASLAASPRASMDLGIVILAVWLAGVVLLTARLALGAWRLSRVVGRSREVPARVADECRAVAARLSVSRGVRVVGSGEMRVPCLIGLARPVLLLPDRQCLDSERADLRAILAHELAHARGHDLAWNGVLHVVALLLWFHPLAWGVRRAHSAACDAVCDAVAADLLGDVGSYGRTLARLALRVAGSPPAHGLAMARTSDVRLRIESLHRMLYRSPLSRRLVMPALVVVGLLAVLVGGFGVTDAGQGPPAERPRAVGEPASPPPAVEKTPGRLTVRVLDATTGEPLEGVEVAYRAAANRGTKQGKPKTGPDGTALVEYDPDAKIGGFTLTLRKAKYVPAHVYLDGSKHPLVIPAIKEFRLESGTTIGGVVTDEAGRPIEGATVSITMPPTESDMANYVFHVGTPKTDARGRWRIDEAPADLGPLGIRVEHPKYRLGYGKPVRGLDGVTAVLTRGQTVTGRVVDGEGKPVEGARAVLGHDIWGSNAPEAKADAAGEFTLENCDPGPSIVTIQAEGFAPQFQDVRVEDRGKTGPVAFTLGPASVIRARVVDVLGKPVPGAYFAADTWRGHRSIMYRGTTDAEGRLAWTSAPSDAVQFDIHKSNYMRSRLVPLLATGEEQVVVLHPELSVSGRVTDASTGEPVPAFTVIRGMTFAGRSQISWSRNEPTRFTSGRYTETFDMPMAAWHLRVEAPGYKPADSRAFRSDEGRQTQDFALEPAEGLVGVVLAPDGKPAAGAEVALATRGVYVALQGSTFNRNYNSPITKTGPDGRFHFPPPEDSYLLIAATDAGFADATTDEFTKSGKLTLVPWGRIEGKVMVGRAPGANQAVSFQPDRSKRGESHFFLGLGDEIQADADGRFVFDRAVPGPGIVSRVVITEFLGSQSHMPCWQEPVEVKSGATVEVTVGGRGRPVVGRVVIDGDPETPIDWRRNSPAEIKLPRTALGQGPRGWDRFASNLDRDGRFHIDDVPPGRYEITVPVNTPPDPRSCGAGTEIGRATRELTVPEGDPGTPIDVGDVVAKLLPVLKVGDPAPDFTARRIDGAEGRFQLGDRRGKVVLLDFWATWCAPCLAEMPAMKELRTTFGADPRFELVGLACDEEPDAPGRYAREHGLAWTQAFAGNLSSGLAASYLVRSIPSTFLIGPDGRIIARNLRGDALRDAVRAALKDEARFKAAQTTTSPPRFPVTRFAVEPEQDRADEPFAVAVLADTDPDFTEGTPHHDTLTFLSASGKMLATLNDFDTCQGVSSSSVLAIDRARGRVYTCEFVAHRVTAFDLRGRRLWRADKLWAHALAVDPKTGNLWCSGGRSLASGETVVLDPEGGEVETFTDHGIAIAHDPRTDGFWLVGYGMTKLGRDGGVLFHRPRDGWAFASVAVDPADGSVWVSERNHPDEARSANRLWHLGPNGSVIESRALGKEDPFAVARDPRTGTVWSVDLRSGLLRRFTPDGGERPPLPIAATAIAISPTDAHIWVTTRTDLLRIDDTGAILSRTPLGSPSGQSWLVAF